jgi:hypothetical protein
MSVYFAEAQVGGDGTWCVFQRKNGRTILVGTYGSEVVAVGKADEMNERDRDSRQLLLGMAVDPNLPIDPPADDCYEINPDPGTGLDQVTRIVDRYGREHNMDRQIEREMLAGPNLPIDPLADDGDEIQ